MTPNQVMGALYSIAGPSGLVPSEAHCNDPAMRLVTAERVGQWADVIKDVLEKQSRLEDENYRLKLDSERYRETAAMLAGNLARQLEHP